MSRADDRDDPTALRRQQEEREAQESRLAREADDDAATRAHARRADKAAYLADRLAAAERADAGD